MIETVVALYFLLGFGAALTHLIKCHNCRYLFDVLCTVSFEFFVNMMSWPYMFATDLILAFKKPEPPRMAAFVSLEGETKEEFEARVQKEINKMNG